MTEKPLIISCHIPEEFEKRLEKCAGDLYEFRYFSPNTHGRPEIEPNAAALLVSSECVRPAGPNLLRHVYTQAPSLPVGIIAPTNCPDTYSALETYNMGTAIPTNPNLSEAQIRLVLQHLVGGAPQPGLKTWMPEGTEVQTHAVCSPEDRNAAQEKVVEAFSECPFADTYDLRLTYEELLNNALRHAFRTGRNTAKYGTKLDSRIQKGDEVTVEWAVHKDPRTRHLGYGALALSDNQGLLAPRQVWDRFFRQTGKSGLLDTNGRGIYLTHLLSMLLLVDVWPGERTEVRAFFMPTSPNQPKPVSIRVRHPQA